jgi:hypothetical protein
VKLARLRRPKAACSPSYAACRPHTMQQCYEALVPVREVMHGRGRETKNLSLVDILSIQE